MFFSYAIAAFFNFSTVAIAFLLLLSNNAIAFLLCFFSCVIAFLNFVGFENLGEVLLFFWLPFSTQPMRSIELTIGYAGEGLTIATPTLFFCPVQRKIIVIFFSQWVF